MPQGEIEIPIQGAVLHGDYQPAADDAALVIFAHGSGSGRHSPRNREVARALRNQGLSTLLFDLLTAEEEAVDREIATYRFNIALLAARLEAATEWAVGEHVGMRGLSVGYFGASTGAAAALMAAARLRERIGAVVCRGGRPDLAGSTLPLVVSPTLLIVGERDGEVHVLNEEAHSQLACEKELALVRGATHLFEEPGALDVVAQLAGGWFRRHLLDRDVPIPGLDRPEDRPRA